jgi:hypothetical protein
VNSVNRGAALWSGIRTIAWKCVGSSGELAENTAEFGRRLSAEYGAPLALIGPERTNTRKCAVP